MMNTILLFFLAAMPQQEFASAQSAYEQVQPTPSETVQVLVERNEFTLARVTELERRIAGDEKKLIELDRLEVERYLALKAHFTDKELEKRLQAEARTFELRRKGVKQSIELTNINLEDARNRLAKLDVDLRLARIEQGLVQTPELATGTPVADRLEARSRTVLLDRAMAVGKFDFVSIPHSWVTQEF
jgi:hypothetical protein